MALTKSRGVDILTPDGNSLASFIDVNDGKWKLKDVNGNVDEAQSYISGGGGIGGSNTSIQFNDSGLFGGDSLFVYDKTNNRLGIGTPTPSNPLDIVKNQASPTRLNIQNTDASGNSSLRFTTLNGLSGIYINASNQLTLQNAINSGELRLQTTNSLGATSNALVIDGNQNIGLGTSTPSFQLDTTNDIRVNGIRIGHGGGNVSKNTVLGESSLIVNTTGDENTAIGYFALSGLGGGNYNTAIGSQSLLACTGSQNTAIGYRSLASVTGGNFNTALGSSALFNSTSGQNTAVGHEALFSNVSGTGLTSIGYHSLRASTGNNNTALGYQAGLANTIGVSNLAIGYQSLLTNISGSENVAVGQSALNNHTVSGATAIGHQAGFSNQTGVGLTAVGYQALRTSTGNNNTALGFQAGNSITTGAGNICIGVNAQPTSATSSNEFVVGSSSVNAGAVTSSTLPASGVATFLWRVRINGTNYSIVMLP